jgi:hypothetical protein
MNTQTLILTVLVFWLIMGLAFLSAYSEVKRTGGNPGGRHAQQRDLFFHYQHCGGDGGCGLQTGMIDTFIPFFQTAFSVAPRSSQSGSIVPEGCAPPGH